MGNTNAVSVKLKGYVWLVATVGVGLLLGLAVTADWDRSPRQLLTIALFTGFIVVYVVMTIAGTAFGSQNASTCRGRHHRAKRSWRGWKPGEARIA